jgi:hypothetical protein
MSEQWELYRDNARLSLLRQFHRAEERIARGVVHTEKDATALRLNMDIARGAFDRLSFCITALAEERPNLAVETWHTAHALFDAIYEIGGLSEISESADNRIVEIENRFRKPARIRVAKAKVDKERMQALDAAILACVDGDRTRLSSYEDKMCPARADVVARLQTTDESILTETWPSVSTVRRRIKKLSLLKRISGHS